MKRTERRSDCPINFALQTFGDAWSLLIIRDLMFTDRRTYTDFLNAEEAMSTNILAARLEWLQTSGLVRRRGEGRGSTFGLTEKGLDLLPAMLDLIAWSGMHDRLTGAPRAFLTRIRMDRAGLIAELRQSLRQEYDL